MISILSRPSRDLTCCESHPGGVDYSASATLEKTPKAGGAKDPARVTPRAPSAKPSIARTFRFRSNRAWAAAEHSKGSHRCVTAHK